MTLFESWFPPNLEPEKEETDMDMEIPFLVRDLMAIFAKVPLNTPIKVHYYDDYNEYIETPLKIVFRDKEVVVFETTTEEDSYGEILWSSLRPVINTQNSTNPDNAGESKQISLGLGSTLKLSDSLNSPKD